MLNTRAIPGQKGDTMTRNKKLLQTALMLFSLACLVFAVRKADRPGSIQIQEEQLTIPGLKHDYQFLLIADTHISLCDERDPDLLEKAQARREAFERESGKNAARTFHNLITESRKSNADLTIFAGDITDSAMYASIDFVQKEMDRLQQPYLYITGNHDFEYGSEYFSKKAYQEYFPRLGSLTQTAQQYVIKEYEDLIVAGINDKNNQFHKRAVRALLPYLKGTKPVILVMHVPLRVLLGETACRPNQATQKLLDAVFAKDSPVAAVFAGHIHFYNHSLLNDRSVQLVTGAGYYGDAVRIRISGS